MAAPEVKFSTHAAESGHWYDPTAHQQIVEVPRTKPGPNGETHRAPTLKDARKHGWYPGITTIDREAAAPGLVRWQIKQAVLAALTLPRKPDETDEAFIGRIIEDSEQQAQKAADRGTEIHAAVQEWFRIGTEDPKHGGKVQAAWRALSAYCGDHKWYSEQIAICPLGYGTKVDLFAPNWVVDWKTKDGDEASLLEEDTYASHWRQLAAGHRALGTLVNPIEECRFAIGFISRTHDAAVIAEIEHGKILNGLAMFDCLLTHWKIRTGYDPATGDVT